jgi:Glycosyltransferase
MKKKLLFIGINMNCGGTEKSFLSFVNCIDFEKFDVDLVLAKADGLFLKLLPPQIHLHVMDCYGDMFFLSAKNAIPLLLNTFVKKNIFSVFEILPFFVKSVFNPKMKAEYAIRMWVKLSKKLSFFNPDTVYDAAFAYWGDRTMFYMVDKVNAKKKFAWLHFDYNYPKRDDMVYSEYFKKCDVVVNVSTIVDESLRNSLPEIADRCIVVENINSSELINKMADEGECFPDQEFTGTRILTVGRIAAQKGLDLAAEALALLLADGYHVRWYVLGNGDSDEKNALLEKIQALDIADNFIFLGTSVNPYRFMRDCDIYAQPSRFEGKPIAVEEAKILAKPILAANYLSASEQLKNGTYGIISQIDEKDIYRKLKSMLDDKALCERLVTTLQHEKLDNKSEFDKILNLL